MMKTFQILILLAAGLSVNAQREGKGLIQFGRMIHCAKPGIFRILELTDYGCYCGRGGSGRPVDNLDRCCQVHDDCYGVAEKRFGCTSIFTTPYVNWYRYDCDRQNRRVTCGPNNDRCGQFICECDRKAAECFARSRLNPRHKNLDQRRCR